MQSKICLLSQICLFQLCSQQQASMSENLSRLTLFKVKSIYNSMKPCKYPKKKIWTKMNLKSCEMVIEMWPELDGFGGEKPSDKRKSTMR